MIKICKLCMTVFVQYSVFDKYRDWYRCSCGIHIKPKSKEKSGEKV